MFERNKDRLIHSLYYKPCEPFNGMVDIKTQEKYFDSAYNCYVGSYENVGFTLIYENDVVNTIDNNIKVIMKTQKLRFQAEPINESNNIGGESVTMFSIK